MLFGSHRFILHLSLLVLFWVVQITMCPLHMKGVPSDLFYLSCFLFLCTHPEPSIFSKNDKQNGPDAVVIVC